MQDCGLKLRPSVDYLISVLNPLFEFPPSLSEEEPLAQFVTILKRLALTLNGTNVQPLLVPVLGLEAACPMTPGPSAAASGTHIVQMPMFACAVGLMAHSDPMVQTTARVVVLTVLRLDCPGVRSAVQETVQRDLAPLVVRISRCPVKLRELVRGRCQWRRDGTLLRRWSVEMHPSEVVASLRDSGLSGRLHDSGCHCDWQDVPVMLSFLPSGERVRYEGIADAAAALEDAMHQDLEVFAEFVQELLDLNVPDVTEGLYSAGLHTGPQELPAAEGRPQAAAPRPPPAAPRVLAAGGASIGEVAGRGREARGAPASEGYRIGDFTRGLMAMGQEARGACDGYRFGDISRGISAMLGGAVAVGRQGVDVGAPRCGGLTMLDQNMTADIVPIVPNMAADILDCWRCRSGGDHSPAEMELEERALREEEAFQAGA
ncbi:unnamed protein product [Prorocentrum cordatum]|nr:unnamed protein product [Polarella glacialis]